MQYVRIDFLSIISILNLIILVHNNPTNISFQNLNNLKEEIRMLSFLSEENEDVVKNNKIIILDADLSNKYFSVEYYMNENIEIKNKMHIDLLHSDSFFLNFEKDGINGKNKINNKILFHTDFIDVENNNNKLLNFTNFKLKDKNSNNFWNITDFLYKDLIINSNNTHKFGRFSTFINEISPNDNITRTLSLSRESDDYEFFKKIKNENFESEDFIFDIENKKIIFGITDEYKKLNLSEIYNNKNNGNREESKNLIELKESQDTLKKKNFTYCQYFDNDYLVLNKKRKFHNCFLSYLYLGENFYFNEKDEILNADSEKIRKFKPIEVKKMAIFDSLTKFIMIPIEDIIENPNNEKNHNLLNYRKFFVNLINEKHIINIFNISNKNETQRDFYCFINDNNIEQNEINSKNINIEENLIFAKKNLICLSKFPKQYIIDHSDFFFQRQNLILNTISYELDLKNLLDQINYDDISFIISQNKQENLFTGEVDKESQNTYKVNKTIHNEILNNEENFKIELINFSKNFSYAFEYKINFYNASKIHKFLLENQENINISLKDNVFEYDSSPVILGTSFLFGFDQISFEESNKKIEFYGGKFRDLKNILDDPSAPGIFSSFIFSSLWVLILILIFLLVPYYFYRRRKRLLMEKLQYDIIYKKMEDITKEWLK